MLVCFFVFVCLFVCLFVSGSYLRVALDHYEASSNKMIQEIDVFSLSILWLTAFKPVHYLCKRVFSYMLRDSYNHAFVLVDSFRH